MKFLFYIFVLFFLGCNSKKHELMRLVDTWRDKEVIFPDSLDCRIFGRDTFCQDMFEKKYKILNYIDTNGCSECRLKLFDWQLLKEKMDTLSSDVALVFVAWVNDYKQLEILQKINGFDTPIFYDKKGELNRLNQFPISSLFQTFLLDRNNKVMLIGNPVGNARLWELYKERMRECVK